MKANQTKLLFENFTSQMEKEGGMFYRFLEGLV
jgi:hypothetical protein